MSTLVANSAKFLVSGAALLRVAQHAQLVAPKNQAMIPVLERLLLAITPYSTAHGDGHSLTFTGSDLENRFTSRALPIEYQGSEAASLCVPGLQLIDLLKNLPDQPLSVLLDETDKHPYVEIKAVPNALDLIPGYQARACYELSGEPGGDYTAPIPLGEVKTHITLAGHVLLAALGATHPITSRDELRPAMTGILVQVNEASIAFVATDGHRLVRFSKVDEHVLDGKVRQFIIPRRAAELLLKLVSSRENVELSVGASQLLVKMDCGELQIRLIDERFPDYENVIPLDNPNRFVAHRAELLAAVRRCGLFCSRSLYQVKLKLDKASCELEAENREEISKATESAPGTYEGKPLTIGFNANFLRYFLEKMPCQSVRFSMSTDSRAAILTSADGEDGLLCLLMPVKINDYNAPY
ncbi:DNA polymerase III subunit beta [Hymenobacter sp. GOD-10R]|uniref:DNA polymerase III subunit beta n=1 Tax=Hymenobacter sp. GOD-10R TaxID=3093922 RepID=UPI002D772A67|nr:DNA polymerase III subunit beta [Hymenobacter sp. GOD-10R]WRQ26698.1 DNA polymerase III subunit beta [Hymenobacter sp. GOD-10R]